MESIDKYLPPIIEMITLYAPRLAAALLVWVLGSFVINALARGMRRLMQARHFDESLVPFLSSLVSVGLKIMLLLAVAGMVGIETASFIAVMAAASFAVGMALQGSLANFAGGVMILVFRPFKVGDVIDAQGFVGSVQAIRIFNTILHTPDRKTIIVPNGALSNGAITNFSTEAERRVDFVFGIGYDDDLRKAKQILVDMFSGDSRVLKDPALQVVVSELADSSVNFTVRAWVKATDYWDLYFEMLEAVKLKFDEEGISIPYPQQDVHMHNAEAK